MSVSSSKKRTTVPDILARKGHEPVVCLTAYTTPMAQSLDPHVDILLVGDSLGMVLYGMDSTLAVDLETMIRHGQAVVRGSDQALVIVDMPFGSFEESPQQAFQSARRVMAKTGCAAVKMEGGVELAPTIKFLTQRGIPVMGHVGLMPQRVNAAGGFRTQGRDDTQKYDIKADAMAIAEAGAFCMVIEAVIDTLAAEITQIVSVPTIGIGASNVCDGQILVSEDAFGLFSAFTPKFVKKYSDVLPLINEAAAAYARDVKNRTFPGPEHSFKE